MGGNASKQTVERTVLSIFKKRRYSDKKERVPRVK